jgi:hypothetical protein
MSHEQSGARVKNHPKQVKMGCRNRVTQVGELQQLEYDRPVRLAGGKLSLVGTAHQEEVEKLFVIREDQGIVR